MGRSVEYLNNSKWTVYINVSDFGQCSTDEDEDNTGYDEDTAREQWKDFKEFLADTIIELYPSFDNVNKWEGREVEIFLKNRLVHVGISEYCGLASLSFAPISEKTEGLADNLIQKMSKKLNKSFMDAFPNTLYCKQGTFSNGEGVYFKVKKPDENVLE